MPVTQEPVSPSVPINLPPPTTGENAQPSSEQPAQVIPPHDVHGYDLKGFYLVMPMISVKNMLKSKGFTIKTIREDIPRFYTTDYEYKCRDEGVIIPEKVRACILNKARKENQAYVAEIDAEHGNERFEFLFTSNNVYNELYKITYYNYGDTSLNFTRVNTMKKLNRQKDFWNAVMDTYGKPDDAQKMIWGDPTKAYMTAKMFGTAYHGMIMFVDQQMYNRDYFFSEDAEAERPSKYHFNFSEG